MIHTRIIPTLLLNASGGLVKTVRFGARTYIGDPINAVRIFNEKEVDELLLLDVDAQSEGYEPRYELIEDIAGEAFMPLAYGGGISSVDQIARLLRGGLEKVVLSTSAVLNPGLVTAGAERFGSQSITVCMDIRKKWWGGYRVTSRGGKVCHSLSPAQWAVALSRAGAGEIIVNSIDRDGTWRGYDLRLLRMVTQSSDVPVVACGGASSTEDLLRAVSAGCTAVAAGSLFVYNSRGGGVLINYARPDCL